MRRKETLAEGVELWFGDCREVLPKLGKVDAVVTDPPYGMNYDTNSKRFSGGKRKRGEGRDDRYCIDDDEPFDPACWLAFRHVILWGANHYAQRLPRGSTLVWLKRHPKNYGTFLSDAEIGWQNRGHGVYVFHAPDSIGRRQLEYLGDAFGGQTAHPFQKPIALMRWCIERVGDAYSILDPFMGSGTTGVAAIQLGRRFIGVEIDEKYFDVAVRRVSEALKQTDFFIEKAKPPKQESLTF